MQMSVFYDSDLSEYPEHEAAVGHSRRAISNNGLYGSAVAEKDFFYPSFEHLPPSMT